MSVTPRHAEDEHTDRGESAADGYVKFAALHEWAEAPTHPLLSDLDEARTRLFDLGLVGMHANGVGFGNLSIRDGAGFIISGSGTGGSRVLGTGGYCRVISFDLEANSVTTRGPIGASSESMSHGAVYGSGASTGCVIHIHARELWLRLLQAGEPATDADAAYGTPAMARAVATLVRSLDRDAAHFAMAGHEDGVIAYGPDVEAAMGEILRIVSVYGIGRKPA